MPRSRSHHDSLAAGALLEAERNLAVESAVLEVLPQVSAGEADALVAMLMARDRSAGANGLLRIFPHLTADTQHVVIGHLDWIANHLRSALLNEADAELRDGAVELISVSHSHRLAPLLAELMSFGGDKDPHAVQRAGEILAEWVRSAGSDNGTALGEEADVHAEGWSEHLGSALNVAIDRWDSHRHRPLLLAAMAALLHVEEKLFTRAADRKSDLAAALNGLVANHEAPEMSVYAVLALGYPNLREAALRRLERSIDPAFWKHLCRCRFLFFDGRVATECRRIRHLQILEHLGGLQSALDDREFEGLSLFIQRTAIPAERKLAVYETWLNQPDEKRACCGFRRLLTISLPEINHILRRRAALRHDGAGRWAGLELNHRERMIQLEELKRSTPRKLNAALLPGDQPAFQAYWQHFDQADHEDRVNVGRQLLTTAPTLIAMLQERLSWPNPAHRARALQIVRELGRVEVLEDAVRALLRDPDAYVRSAAMAALGEQKTELPHHVLHAALQDSDPRVQANTVEALAHQQGEGYQHLLVDKLSSPHHRVRANAIAALLQISLPDAAAALLDMLDSVTAEERLSGLWVVEQLRLNSIHDHLARMANADPDGKVRRRAAELVQQSSRSIDLGISTRKV